MRPVERDDLERILEWRNSERIRTNMYSDHVITMEEHRAWFERTKQHSGSIYLIFEIRNQPAGLVYFADIDRNNGKSHWGFYLGAEDLPRGSGTAMGVIGLEYAFTQLNLRKLYGEVFAFNEASLRFHKKLGFVEEGRFAGHVLKSGVYEDVVSLALFREEWQKSRQALDAAAFESDNGVIERRPMDEQRGLHGNRE